MADVTEKRSLRTVNLGESFRAAAFVLNHLDSVEAALAEDLDVTEDNLKLYRLVDELLSMPAQLAAQINPEGGY